MADRKGLATLIIAMKKARPNDDEAKNPSLMDLLGHKPDDAETEESEQSGFEAACQAVLDAIKADDPKAFAQALKDAIGLCHEESGEDESIYDHHGDMPPLDDDNE